MKALTFDGERLAVDDVLRTDVVGEASVRVILSGICNTDIEIARGYAGFTGILGHEFVGVVEDCPDTPEIVGKRVVGEINAGCGTCNRCSVGDPRHCETRTVLGIVARPGAHAEFLSLPSRNLLVVPDNVADEAAVFTEPLAAAIGISERVAIDRNSRLAVIGDGKLGLLIAMAMRLRCDDVTLIGRHSDKLAIAEKRNILTRLSSDLADDSSAFDLVIEASGSEQGFSDALRLVKPLGTIVLKSTFHGQPKWDAARVVVDEIAIVGSRCGRFQSALEALASGAIDPTDMIACEMPLADGVAAMQQAAASGVLKVLLRP